MRLILIILLASLLSCRNLQAERDYCHVPENVKQEIVVKLEEFLKTLNDDEIRYEPSTILETESRLYKDKARCFIYISPVALRDGFGVLDGDGGIYIDLERKTVGPVFWYKY